MVKIKSSTMVTPAEPTPNVRIPLPDHDRVKMWVQGPVDRTSLFFYRPQLSNSSPIETLKSSLRRALVPYYPFAGRLNSIGGGRHELICNAKGALVVEAESEAELKDFGDFRPIPEMTQLGADHHVVHATTDSPLLLIQLTQFKCGGICFGLSSSRMIADAKAKYEFITTWANIARGQKVTLEPVHDYTPLLYQGSADLQMPINFDFVELNSFPLLVGDQDDKEERKKETVCRMFKLSKEQVDTLKKKANEGRAEDLREYSRYEAISGHIWRCACKARNLVNNQQTCLRTTVDFRNRVKPPLPVGFFGSATTVTAAVATSGELVSDSLGFACGVIRRSLDKVNDEYVRAKINYLGSQEDLNPILGIPEGVFMGNPNLSITSWARLPMYEVDFGWGNPIYVGPGSAIGVDGKVLIIRGSDEVDSFMVAVFLQVAHMDTFEKLFYNNPPIPIA